MGKSIAIVGGESVGRSVGRGLRESGWRIGSVISVDEATARAMVRAVGAGTPHAGLTRLVLTSSVTLISVPQKELARVAAELAAMGSNEWRGKTVLHTCETHDHSALHPLARRGASTASLHPLYAFDKRKAAPLHGVFFGIEGEVGALKIARSIVHDLGGVAVRLNRVRYGLLEVAMRFARNDVALLVNASVQILNRIGFSTRQAESAAIQLARQSLSNFKEHASRRMASAGEAFDAALFQAQANALREFPAEYANVYEALHMKTGADKVAAGRNSWQH
ncbi:MAG TPA: DUF2520 domain-containing protein [Candidatus Acidoferrales bacterium]|nr:DUF2520 domain-containing protein [Candidatus Acidoferrales bacterium]